MLHILLLYDLKILLVASDEQAFIFLSQVQFLVIFPKNWNNHLL
jgi:hypothetical protein